LSQTKEIDGLFLILDQQTPALREPRQDLFDHPSARWVGLLAITIELFLADTPDMWGVLIGCHGPMPSWIVIALIQAAMLRPLLGRLVTPYDDGLQALAFSSFISCTLTPAMVAPRRPPVAFTTRLRFIPFSCGVFDLDVSPVLGAVARGHHDD
jgi:hypothetical protein